MTNASEATKTTIRIGISSCLLDEAVRYNGAHKRDSYLNDVLGASSTSYPTKTI